MGCRARPRGDFGADQRGDGGFAQRIAAQPGGGQRFDPADVAGAFTQGDMAGKAIGNARIDLGAGDIEPFAIGPAEFKILQQRGAAGALDMARRSLPIFAGERAAQMENIAAKGARCELNRLARGDQVLFVSHNRRKHAAQFEQALAQAGARLRLAAVAPEQPGEPFARHPVLRRQQQRGEHGARTAALDRNGRTIGSDKAERPDQLDMETRTCRHITPEVFRYGIHANLVPAPVIAVTLTQIVPFWRQLIVRKP